MVYYLRIVSHHSSSYANTVIVALVPTATTKRKNYAHKNAAATTYMILPTRRRVPNATTRWLGALLPGLSSTFCIFDGSVRIYIIASTPHPDE